jgi:sugar phosphate isomerase/epimerase
MKNDFEIISQHGPADVRKMSRRDWLKWAGAMTLGAPTVFGASAVDLKARAKKNIKLAVFSGVYAGLPLEDAARRIKADGFQGVALEYRFADVTFDPLKPDWAAADKIRNCFERQGLPNIGLYGYYNVVDPDSARRQRGEQRMRFLVENWKRLGSPVVATETGTLNAKSEWVESPENSTEKGYLTCRDSLAALVKAAEKSGAIVAIEPYWRNIIDSAARTERLFSEIKSPALKLVMDPCNYFRKEDLAQMDTMLEEIFRRVGSQTVVAHAKDVQAAENGTDLPASGKGVLNYPLFLRLLARMDREMFLAVEHLTLDDVPRARDFVLSQFDKV